MTQRCVDTLTHALDDLPLEDGSVVEGSPRAGVASVMTLGVTEVGIWELTEGTVTDTEVDELFVVVAGQGTVSFEDGETIDLHPGVLVQLRAGERTTWVISETLRKVWISG